MRLTVEAQRAQIGINTRNASVERSSTLPKLNLKTEQGSIELNTTQPKIQIDQRQCFSESGLKGILELASEEAQRAIGTMYESVGRIVEQGNALTDIQYGGNPIADQAYYNAYDQFTNEFNMVTMPRSRPKITLIRGEINLKSHGGTVEGEYVKGEMQAQYNPGKVEIYMLQEQQFKMRFEETQFDKRG